MFYKDGESVGRRLQNVAYPRLRNLQQEPRLETSGGKIRKQSTEDHVGELGGRQF